MINGGIRYKREAKNVSQKGPLNPLGSLDLSVSPNFGILSP